MTKEKFANGVSVMYRILGIAGSSFLTYESFSSMGQKLVNDLDVACFAYTEEKANADFIIIEKISKTEDGTETCSAMDEN